MEKPLALDPSRIPVQTTVDLSDTLSDCLSNSYQGAASWWNRKKKKKREREGIYMSYVGGTGVVLKNV